MVKTVLFVGGSHSIHVRIPANIICKSGYRIVLADLQGETDAEVYDIFDEVYRLEGLESRIVKFKSTLNRKPDSAQDGQLLLEKPTRLKSYFWALFSAKIKARRLTNIVLKEKPGIIYFQSMTAGGTIAYYLLKNLKWPDPENRPGLITHLWGYRPRYPGIRKREIKALQYFDHVHSSSPAIIKTYNEYYYVPPQKSSFFVRGISKDDFGPKSESVLQEWANKWKVPDKFVIIHNRHLHPMYRVDIAVDALIELTKRGCDVCLMLVRGSMYVKEYEKRLYEKLRKNNCEDRMLSLSPNILNSEQMAIALQLSDCAVNCVPFDAFGISIIEAMYCKAVPIVRDLPSYIQFVKDGQTAFAVGPSPVEYADRIEELINDPSLRERLIENGRALVSKEGTEQIYKEKILGLVKNCWHNWGE